jgi:hypothetical protein
MYHVLISGDAGHLYIPLAVLRIQTPVILLCGLSFSEVITTQAFRQCCQHSPSHLLGYNDVKYRKTLVDCQQDHSTGRH